MADGRQRASWKDLVWVGSDPTAVGSGSRRTTRSRLSRGELEGSAATWNIVGVVFLVLAATGSVIIGITLAPQTVSRGFYSATTETDYAAGFAIGAGVFLGSLVTILPYFMFSRVMKALADLMPPKAEA